MLYRFLRFPGFKVKAFTVSYDDGQCQDRRLVSILDKNGIRGTFNLNSWSFRENSGEKYIGKDEVLSLYKNHAIAIHGEQHKSLYTCSPAEAIDEVLACRKTMESFFGKPVRGLAYPDRGVRNNDRKKAEVEELLRMLGIAYARTGGASRSFDLPVDFLFWVPTCKHDAADLFDLADAFLAAELDKKYRASRDPLLFYVWGHSYECDAFWDRTESFYEKMGGHDDVFYATNEQLYDYITAYHSLVTSADGNILYNPTLLTVYFDADGRQVSLVPGEQIILP